LTELLRRCWREWERPSNTKLETLVRNISTYETVSRDIAWLLNLFSARATVLATSASQSSSANRAS
jgi:hypothetical protein